MSKTPRPGRMKTIKVCIKMNTTNTGLAPGSEWQLMLTLGKSAEGVRAVVVAIKVVEEVADFMFDKEDEDDDDDIDAFFITTVFATIL